MPDFVPEKPYRIRTKFVATRNVHEYRETIPTCVNQDDTVLEIGCEFGTTTALLAQAAREVLGTDISAEVLTTARAKNPNIRFEVLDGFDVRAALDFGLNFTKVYIDMSGMSGYRSLLDAIALLNTYAAVLRPKIIVVKSNALKNFASQCFPWNAYKGHWPNFLQKSETETDEAP